MLPKKEKPKQSKSVYGAPPASQEIESHTLSIVVINEPGVLARVVGLFSGRGYNIESLTVAETDHDKHLSRITIVVKGTLRVIEQIKTQLDRMVPVKKVRDLTTSGIYVAHELALVKVKSTEEQRDQIIRTAQNFPAQTIDANPDFFIFEVTGNAQKIDEFVDLMRPLGLHDVSRTGVAAISRGKIKKGTV